ncbi:hypothetical protein [Actinoplanes sp. NBRC 101535]|uniref:hypothetical protein n=1 Tax=Actinoplanes sp. NBRC 101535 TaxID=3032196 RepID=UPI0024A44A6E|nr:hypothetical protein [Actinoplanes sp. NBRC 101535]GLY08195.1 hypothetical protein Acsp01_85740 [Actinoplanes sp. NBRC 101535]
MAETPLHWHGYGPWTGSADTLRAQEHQRRPGPALTPMDPATGTFLGNSLPPMQTGHWLLRRTQTTADQTWTDVDDVLAWLTKQYAAHPPTPLDSYLDLDARLDHSRAGLLGGADAWWHYYTGGGIAVYSAICCPHRHLTQIPCPLKPSP